MLPFHEGFRRNISQISALLLTLSPSASSSAKNKFNNLANLLYLSSGLCHHLETHHMIEERFIFPILAKKLPQFANSSQHTIEHQQMHKAIHNLESYVEEVSGKLRSGKVKNGEGWRMFMITPKW